MSRFIRGLTLSSLAAFIGYGASAYPDTLWGITFGLLAVFILSKIFLRKAKKNWTGNWWRQVIQGAILARFAVVFLHLVIGVWFYRGVVDFLGWHRWSVIAGERLLQGSADFLVEIENYSLAHVLPMYLLAVVSWLTGPSIIGMFQFSAILGFLGSYLFLRAFEVAFPESGDRRFLALMLFLLPSIVFWSSLIGKDSWIFFLLGLGSYSLANIWRALQFRHLLGFVSAFVGIAIIRPHIGLAFTVAVGIGWICRLGVLKGTAELLKPVAVSLFIAMVVLVLYAVAARVRETFRVTGFSPQDIAAYYVQRHVGFSTTPGGSTLPVAIHGTSPWDVLKFLPWGLATVFFRPFIFEAHNALALLSALENTFLLIVVLMRWRNCTAAVKRVFSDPYISFVTTALLVMAMVISVEWNLGAIIRSRTMILPFLVILLSYPVSRPKPRLVTVQSAFR